MNEITLVCPSPGYLIVDHSLPADNPGSTVYGWPVAFSDISLTFIKESE